MGEAKRRKEKLGEKYGQEENILPGIPLSKSQGEKFVQITTKASWIGIVLLIIGWVTIRWVGPSFGWWQVVN